MRSLVCSLVVTASLVACSSDSTSSDADPKPVLARYPLVAKLVYQDTLLKARAMQSAIDAFVAAPSAGTLEAARSAWLAARGPYGQSESYRFFNGPIDDERGPEGRVNAWPLDEAFIDYVDGDATAGIINHPSEFPQLTKEVLSEQNEKGGEANVATGWHAIEFLLWGQDKSESGPGARPFSDYVAGASGPQAVAARRGEYLKTVTALLVEDLEIVVNAWDPAKAGSYGAAFATAPAEESLTKAFKGMVQLTGFELSRERMNNAYTKGEQEEEHSCFSDNTHADLLGNALASENVYLGRYGNDDGPGLDDLVRAKDPAADALVKERFEAAIDAIKAIPVPFDQSILREPGRSKVKAAIDACEALAHALIDAAKVLGITVNIAE